MIRLMLSGLVAAAFTVVASAQGNFDESTAAPANEAVWQDPAPTPATAPGKSEEQLKQEEEALKIQARREARASRARHPGTSQRMDPMRAFPGELPVKSSFIMDLEGRNLQDASKASIQPSLHGGHAVQDPLAD